MPRLVRVTQLLLLTIVLASAAAIQAGESYIDNKDGTITDSKHGLMWQRADDGVERSWKEAVNYCETLELAGHEDWLLPKADQLEWLIDTAYSPTIDPLFSVKASYYWSATESTDNSGTAKYVNFFYGNTYSYSKDNPYYVLCVRETKAIAGKELAAVFTGTPMAGKPLMIHFTAMVTGGSEPYFYHWDFGDGGESSATDPTHEFAKEGQYEVLLTLSDNDGAIVVTNQEIILPLAELPAVPVAEPEKSAPPADKPKEKMLTATPTPETGPAVGTEQGTSADAPMTARKPRGVMDVSASGQGEPYKAGALGHGLLAYTFANAMSGDGDWDKDGSVTASELQSYLDQAVKSLSKGQQSPVISRDGDDFAICAASPGSTYVLGIGIGHDLAGVAVAAGQDVEWVRKAVEDKCRDTKTLMLTGDHANRGDVLEALVKIGSMVTTDDNLIVYIGAANGRDNGRLNWYVNDSSKELPWFTGIYHDDLLQFLEMIPVGHLMVLGEKN